MSRENKDKRFEIRLSESERDRFFTAAEACKMTPSQYMRTMLWFLHPAKLPTEKYSDMLEQLLEMNKNLRALTAEIKLSGEIPSEEIELATQKIDILSEEVLFAIWFLYGCAKVCVYVDSEEALLDIAKKANERGIIASVITDSGMTEFHGVPTKTCLALEPLPAEVADELTGDLPLY